MSHNDWLEHPQTKDLLEYIDNLLSTLLPARALHATVWDDVVRAQGAHEIVAQIKRYIKSPSRVK